MTLAAKVDNKNGTAATSATPKKTFDLYFPEPPKSDDMRPLSGDCIYFSRTRLSHSLLDHGWDFSRPTPTTTLVRWAAHRQQLLFESAGALFGIDLEAEPPESKALSIGRTCFATES